MKDDPASNEEKQQEAAARLKLLKVFDETARQFIEDGRLSYSMPPWGACYWIDEKMQAAVDAFEKKTGGLVYHIIRTPTENLGTLDSFLYVSRYKNEWPADRQDIEAGIIYCYVSAGGGPGFSEFGTIGFKQGLAGGLLRTQ